MPHHIHALFHHKLGYYRENYTEAEQKIDFHQGVLMGFVVIIHEA